MLIPQEREKHLPFLVESKQKQIPRSARDDTVAGYFSSAC
jgi:hypothetical protein